MVEKSLPHQEGLPVYRSDEDEFERIAIDENGIVSISHVRIGKGRGKERTLYINVGNENRARQFAAKRNKQGKPSRIKSFAVSATFVQELRESAIPENMAADFPELPTRVDEKYEGQYGLTSSEWIDKLRNAIVQGSGRIVE